MGCLQGFYNGHDPPEESVDICILSVQHAILGQYMSRAEREANEAHVRKVWGLPPTAKLSGGPCSNGRQAHDANVDTSDARQSGLSSKASHLQGSTQAQTDAQMPSNHHLNQRSPAMTKQQEAELLRMDWSSAIASGSQPKAAPQSKPKRKKGSGSKAKQPQASEAQPGSMLQQQIRPQHEPDALPPAGSPLSGLPESLVASHGVITEEPAANSQSHNAQLNDQALVSCAAAVDYKFFAELPGCP